MVEFETIEAEEISFGNNNFIEVAKKKAISEDGENVFISISRGFVAMNGEKRYRKSFTVPLDKAVIDFVSTKLKGLEPTAEEAAQKEEKAAKKGEKTAKEEETEHQMNREKSGRAHVLDCIMIPVCVAGLGVLAGRLRPAFWRPRRPGNG